MPITPDQARMLAKLAAACRPYGARRWDEDGIYANIGKVRDRSLAAVTIAVIQAAEDAGAVSPGVIPAAGPHWRTPESAPTPAHVERTDPAALCGTCSEPRDRCRVRWADDHDFETQAQLMARIAAERIDNTAARAGLRDAARDPLPEPDHVEPAPNPQQPLIDTVRAALRDARPAEETT